MLLCSVHGLRVRVVMTSGGEVVALLWTTDRHVTVSPLDLVVFLEDRYRIITFTVNIKLQHAFGFILSFNISTCRAVVDILCHSGDFLVELERTSSAQK